MTVDEAKAVLVYWRGSEPNRPLLREALELALSLIEREPLVHELIVAARQNEQSDKNDSDFKPRLGRALDALLIYPDSMPEHPKPEGA